MSHIAPKFKNDDLTEPRSRAAAHCRPVVSKRLPDHYVDTMYPGWFAAAVETLAGGPKVEIYDWRRKGGRWITIHASSLDPRAIGPALERMLRAEGVSPRRFRR